MPLQSPEEISYSDHQMTSLKQFSSCISCMLGLLEEISLLKRKRREKGKKDIIYKEEIIYKPTNRKKKYLVLKLL